MSHVPTYRLLGESGLVEDEEGNVFSASEIDDSDESDKPAASRDASALLGNFSFVSALDDKANPAHWYYDYDPRYCGPSREEYMEKMARQYRDSNRRETEKEENSVATESEKEAPVSAREKADREQEEVERLGLRPLWNQHKNGPSFAGIVNRNNEVVISEKKYSLIGQFSNGLAIAQSRKTKKFGFVDRHGNEVIPCTWRSVGPFSEYMACVQDDNKKCGYVDVTGRLVIPCTCKEGWPFHEGLARVQEGDWIGMIDQCGKLVIPCVWKAMGDFSEGLAGVRDDGGKCGYVNRAGKVVIPCRWKQVWTFCEERAVVQDFNKRLGFIDKSGALVIPCRWKKANYFKDGLAKVSDSKKFFFQDKWVYIDKQGLVVEVS